MKKVSIIIPAYNEEKRILKTLNAYAHFASSLSDAALEVHVVSDGSIDHTNQIVTQFINENPLLVIKLHHYYTNQGKGYALKYGLQHSDADWYYFADADLSANWNILTEFLNYAQYENYDGIIGSRALLGSDVKTNIFRKYLGNIGNKFIRTILKLPFHDTQCGYKLFNASCKNIILQAKNNSWAFDFEMLYLLQKNNKKIKEHKINWHNEPGGKVHMLSYLKALRDLILIKIRS